MSSQYKQLDNHELKLLKMESPSNKLKLSQFFDRKFSMNKIKNNKQPVKSIQKETKEHQLHQQNILSDSMNKSRYPWDDGNVSPSQLIENNDYIKSRMYCRLMHTKRGNLWNEWHKLDKKRIRLLMNKFVIQKDHEAMQYIIKNHQKELAQKNSKLKQKLIKVENIKKFKIKQKISNLKKLKNIERKNFDSVVRYLKDTIPENDIRQMLKHSKPKKRKKKKGRKIPEKENVYEQTQYNVGEKRLFSKLSKINNNIYQQVYEETQKKFTSSNRKKSKYNSKIT